MHPEHRRYGREAHHRAVSRSRHRRPNAVSTRIEAKGPAGKTGGPFRPRCKKVFGCTPRNPTPPGLSERTSFRRACVFRPKWWLALVRATSADARTSLPRGSFGSLACPSRAGSALARVTSVSGRPPIIVRFHRTTAAGRPGPEWPAGRQWVQSGGSGSPGAGLYVDAWTKSPVT